MNGYEIVYHLKRRGVKVKDIANQFGVSGPAVSQVIHGKDSSRRISEAIAKAIGMPVGQVFPKYRSQSKRVGANDKEAA